MNLTDSIIHYRRLLKRKNYTLNTLRTYMSHLKQYIVWLRLPVENATAKTIDAYIDYLLKNKICAKTINCHLVTIRGFYEFLQQHQGVAIENPVRANCWLRLSRPLPKHLTDTHVAEFLKAVDNVRDRAMFMLMLRCGLRVSEVANLSLAAIDWHARRLYVFQGKGRKDRLVYISNDTLEAMAAYINQRQVCRQSKVFLVQRGRFAGRPISVRGIQKRMEYYAEFVGLNICCHHLRHTMATQLLNADAPLVSIQDLLGHSSIKTTQRYSTISNVKVQRDYENAMTLVMQRSLDIEPTEHKND